MGSGFLQVEKIAFICRIRTDSLLDSYALPASSSDSDESSLEECSLITGTPPAAAAGSVDGELWRGAAPV